MSELQYRRATSADAPLFEEWNDRPHVRAAVTPDASAGMEADWSEELDDERLVYIVVSEGTQPIGFLAIVDPATDPYWGEMPPGLRAIDIIIGEPDRLGRGLGSRMMAWAIERCFADPGVEAILVDPLVSNEGAISFYRSLGFREVERRRFDSDCLVMRLDRP